MGLSDLLSDRCTIQNRTVDASGKTDTETWTAQASPVRCRVIKQPSRRRTSPEGSEKIQYGTFVFTSFILEKSAAVTIHDRIAHEGRVYDVLEVVSAWGAYAKHHQVALCDARA